MTRIDPMTAALSRGREPPRCCPDDDPSSRGRTGDSRAIAAVRLVLAVALAAYPWAYTAELVGQSLLAWTAWAAALTVHAALLAIRPSSGPLMPAASLALVAGLCAMHASIVFARIVQAHLNIDYFVLANWISAASRGLLDEVANRPTTNNTYFQYYLDPLIPLLNRIVGLTESPFRLLAFHTLAVLGPALILWAIAIRSRRLYPFQALLPAAYLLHPGLVANVQADYHTSGIGAGLLLVGSYLFFSGRPRGALVPLLLGTLTKVSFWLSWPCFALALAARRRWRLSALYGGAAAVALAAYLAIQPASGSGASYVAGFFFGHLGGAEGEAAIADRIGDFLTTTLPARLAFLFLMALPFGVGSAFYPRALLPLAPLAGITLIEQSGFRSNLYHQYAVEYLGFLAAATVLGLTVARRGGRLGSLVAMGLGIALSLNLIVAWGPPDAAYEPTIRQALRPALVELPRYERDVEFAACASGGRPTLATLGQQELVAWPAYAREPLAAIWIDQAPLGLPAIDAAFRRIGEDRWPGFETLVYRADPSAVASLALFPMTNGLRDAPEYARLLARLPVEVTTDTGWRYRGGERLRDCAQQFGYAATVREPATPVRAERLPALDLFPCDAEVARMTWWFNRSDLLTSGPDAQDTVERLLQHLEAVHNSLDPAQVICFAKIAEAERTLGTDWRPDNPPPDAPCDTDLVLAGRYHEHLFDARLAATTLPALNAATVAERRRDSRACLLAAASVRRAYFDDLASSAPPRPEPPIAEIGRAIPYRLTSDTADHLDRFPCAPEAARLAAWGDRPDLVHATPEARMAVARAVEDASVKDSIVCYADVRRADALLRLDWQPANPPPPGGSCAADLAAAAAYYDGVLGNAERARALPLLNRAVLANHRGDLATCLLAAAAVRRAYLEGSGDPTLAVTWPPPDPAALGQAMPGEDAPFALRPDAVSLALSFPCRAEVTRLGWWYDRPHLVSHGPAVESAMRRLTAALDGSAFDCLRAVQAAELAFDLPGRLAAPPPAFRCEPERLLADAYLSSVFTPALRERTASDVAAMSSAVQAGDETGCIRAAGAIRSAYFAEIGATPADGAATSAPHRIRGA